MKNIKVKRTTAILALFLGGLGAHRFYLGQTGKGIISILFCWTYIPVIIGIIDFFVFIFMSNDAFDINYNNAINLSCSACNIPLGKNNISKWTLGKSNIVCKNCFSIIRQHSKEKHKYDFSEKEVKEILANEVKDRPIPVSLSLKINVHQDEFFETYELLNDINILNLNTLAHISYTDVEGQQSERNVTMKSIYQCYDKDYIITAFCHEKKAQRSFKLSRINKLVDIETGEIFSNPSNYFLEKFRDSPEGLIFKCFQELEAEILVLSFMARADGYLRKKEREIIASFIQSKNKTILNNKILEEEIRKIYCESSDFRKALKFINCKTENEKLEIYKLVSDIINTDKKPDPIEVGILELIRKEFKISKSQSLSLNSD